MKTVKNIIYLLGFPLALLLSGCNYQDDNDRPIYSKENGLPINCRAYVQVVIDDYRARNYSADEAMNGLERNCGANGWSWKNVRDKK